MGCTGTCRTSCCIVALLAVWPAHPVSGQAEQTVPRQDLNVVLRNALQFVRSQQNAQGGFGAVQAQLQTSLGVLAILSMASDPTLEDLARIERAVDYLIRVGTTSGDLGDAVFRVESHALAATAVLCAIQHVRDPALRQKASEVVQRAIRLTQRLQDRSRASPARGGWKMEGRKGTQNDRRASAWALLVYDAASRYGVGIKRAHIDRGVHFVLGSFKKTADNPDQIGGLSVDTEGLAVASISAMGGWVLSRLAPDDPRLDKNVAWLAQHPPIWSGPNYFYTEFFRVRALKFADPGGPHFHRALRRVYLQIREHQQPDGSVTFPPGNAQNTIAMGPTFSTSLAVLILNVENSPLVFDEDYRVRPLF